MNNFIRHPNELAIKNITIPIDASNPMVKTWTGVTIWLSLPAYRKRVLIIHFPLLKIREHINQGSISRISINESKQLYFYLHNRQSYCSTSIHLHPTTSPKLCQSQCLLCRRTTSSYVVRSEALCACTCDAHSYKLECGNGTKMEEKRLLRVKSHIIYKNNNQHIINSLNYFNFFARLQ